MDSFQFLFNNCHTYETLKLFIVSPGRNYGYAKFASKEPALRAMHTLHGQSIGGQRLKVLEAESPKGPPPGSDDDGPSKKQRL